MQYEQKVQARLLDLDYYYVNLDLTRTIMCLCLRPEIQPGDHADHYECLALIYTIITLDKNRRNS